MKRLLAIAGTVVGLTFAAPLSAASAAPAYPFDLPNNAAFLGDGVNIRTGPGTNYTIVGQGYRSHNASASCIYYQGHRNSSWYYVRDDSTGAYGYVSARYISFSCN